MGGIGCIGVEKPAGVAATVKFSGIRAAPWKPNGHRGNASRALWISERNLYRKLKEHKLLG